MKLSVITINKNNLQGLKRTIPSVINQCSKEFEYIVIDGASDDGSKEYIESISGITKFVSEPDSGIYNAMNKGVRMASGDYVIFMNSGDAFHSDMVVSMVLPILGEKDLYVGHEFYIRDFVMDELVPPPQELSLKYLLHEFLPHQSTFIRREMLIKRPYDETLKIVADWKSYLFEYANYSMTYSALPIIVADFDSSGISATLPSLTVKEQNKVREELFALNPATKDVWMHSKREPRINISYLPKNITKKQMRRIRSNVRLHNKCLNALNLSPLARDWKITRNGLKWMFRDFLQLFSF